MNKSTKFLIALLLIAVIFLSIAALFSQPRGRAAGGTRFIMCCFFRSNGISGRRRNGASLFSTVRDPKYCGRRSVSCFGGEWKRL